MLVTWPFVMLLLDYWPLDRLQPGSVWRLLMEKIPFFVLTAVTSVVTFMVQKHGGALVVAERLSFGLRMGNALVSCCRYLAKMIWPADLAVFYPLHGQLPPGKLL